MGSVGEAVLEAGLAFLADPIRMPGNRVRKQPPESTTAELPHCPERAGTRMIDTLPRTLGDAFEMRLRVARGNHRLEFGGVFAEVMPERCECGRFGRAPRLSKPPSQQCGRSKVLLEIVRRSISRTTMGNRSRGFLEVEPFGHSAKGSS
jgi:hypothetical protein